MNTQQIIETAEEKLIHTYNRYQIVLDKGDGVRLYDTDEIGRASCRERVSAEV